MAAGVFLVVAGAKSHTAAEGKAQTKCGEVRYDRMIPLENLRPGWGTGLEWWQNNAKLGVVGHEIYGAGRPIWMPFGRMKSMNLIKPTADG
jgi:hypothetical protein